MIDETSQCVMHGELDASQDALSDTAESSEGAN